MPATPIGRSMLRLPHQGRLQQGAQAFDWVAAGRTHQQDDHKFDKDESAYTTLLAGTFRKNVRTCAGKIPHWGSTARVG